MALEWPVKCKRPRMTVPPEVGGKLGMNTPLAPEVSVLREEHGDILL